jgi:hypothetical protein
MYINFNFSQELEDRLNPKQNGDAKPQTTSLYARIQGKTFFALWDLSAWMLWTFYLLCPVSYTMKHKKIVNAE